MKNEVMVAGHDLVNYVKRVVSEGNVRRIIIRKEDGDILLEVPLTAGDHVCFLAGVDVPHHVRNTSNLPLKLLVFGERKSDEVVFYPDAKVMLVRSDGRQQLYNYEQKES